MPRSLSLASGHGMSNFVNLCRNLLSQSGKQLCGACYLQTDQKAVLCGAAERRSRFPKVTNTSLE